VVGILFLELNGFRYIASEEDATQSLLSLVAGAIDESEYVAWLQASSKRESTWAKI